MSNARTGLLLVNLGTPDAPSTGAVRRYLREFLSDPKVIDLPGPARWLLVNGIIAPFRSPKSAEAYRKIWTDEGSPLLLHGEALRDGLQRARPETDVALAMRYGKPRLTEGLRALKDAGCGHVLVAPLYPQEADSTTASTVEAVRARARGLFPDDAISFLPPFYAAPPFLAAWRAVAAPVLAEFGPDHVLFSYHGLPERHVRKADPSGRHCLASDDCSQVLIGVNASCYRAQCYATTRGIRDALGLDEEQTSTAFQSRLGRTPWIRPYTDEALRELPGRGVRRLAVVCPAFVADCLETLEEIGIRGDATFREAGGEELRLVPSLNAHPAWIDALGEIVRPLLTR